MNNFEFYGYDELPSILTLEECVTLERNMEEVFNPLPVEYDQSRGLVKVIYRPDPAQFVFERVHYFLERYLNTKLHPTYWFCTQYYHKSYMVAHTDREACEISVSLNIAQTMPWSLRVKDKTGKRYALETLPGDAVLYAGIDVEHWRTPYKGRRYTQLFLHYVKQHGKYSKFAYDQRV